MPVVVHISLFFPPTLSAQPWTEPLVRVLGENDGAATRRYMVGTHKVLHLHHTSENSTHDLKHGEMGGSNTRV